MHTVQGILPSWCSAILVPKVCFHTFFFAGVPSLAALLSIGPKDVALVLVVVL